MSVQNLANRRARAKTGFRPYERMDYLRLGPRAWHWHRKVDARLFSDAVHAEAHGTRRGR